ncbi:MAG: HD domain-containing protein [Chitinispirillaceae bacterium]|nr:HD domain-containing protein [Chitinispirillaceae bacterium]
MKKTKIFSNYLNSLRSDPIFVVLDSLYYQNPDASIFKSAPAKTRYSSLLGDLDRILYTDLNAAPKTIRDLPFSRIFSLAEMILFSLVNSKDILAEVMRPTYLGDYFLFHTLNVAFLSCQAAIGLGLPYKELLHVCVVALLHDIGMKFINQDSFEHAGELSESQRAEIDHHFEETFRFFKNLEKDLPFLLKVIGEEDNRLKHRRGGTTDEADPEVSESIKWHTYAEIVNGCNTFEALCHDRPFRKAFHPADAMRMFVEECKRSYDRKFIRAIIESITLYPITSLVRLNNNRIGRVIDIVEGCPLSPIVAVIADGGDPLPDEPELTGEIIDLSQKPTVFIDGLVYNSHYGRPK